VKRERFPTDVEEIFAEIKSVPKDMKHRREFQHILLCTELHDMAVEREVYRRIAIEYCTALNKDAVALNGASRELMVDNEAERAYEIEKCKIAEEINRGLK
jgi:hypothetical protein